MSQRRAALESQKKQDRVHVMLDFSFLKQYMEKGGMVIQTFKCSNCGAPIQIPETGNSVNCTHCQTPQHVDDIFKKIQQIIG
jgi:LSD1 subclass zinc finger protein